MSFPYPQYVDYSNPATPSVYAWEVASATSDQDPTLQLPPQDSQPQRPQPQQQQQQISPSQLQLHQLPLPLPPQLQQLPTPQEHPPPTRQHYTPHPQTIQVAPSVAQPHYRFETLTEEDYAHASATGERPGSSRRRGASKPPSLHVDTSRASSASATAAVASPGALSSAGGGTGPLRVPPSRAHSRAASGSGVSSAAAGVASAQAPVRSRRVSELQSAQTLETSVGGTRTGVLPTVGTAMAVSCPASSSWREGLLGLSASVDPEATPTGALPRPAEPVRRYGIRADINFSTEENVITAMFEIPGVKRNDIHITMSVCPFSRVRQVSISGLSRSILPLQGHTVRERKFGEFFRTMVVPPETKAEDITVSLEDGILTMKIPGGTPAPAEQAQNIPLPELQ
ncbi:hypothetical protein L227DRAFT_594959 [Lentinus tigrinus ALCF2SS1-6]|uniref:SHSP domain-containing protein n=1 Tax=Lentinus tigrinus ALCF2SS1-6 TaxID=1328759 RepID=A0A5C2S2G6_9APHY|nr:hypothetical protein L227DRAFT_594959 [Lentinus tigrinus ALCF2SS1-6]